jgi:hypothetical protein
VKEFVEECRREWKRLGVPDQVADEMAADLEADLEEAAAEGVSSEEVLGSAADPRSLASAWAAERGLTQQPPPSGRGLPSRWRIAAAIGAFALIASVGAVLVILASPSTPARLTLATPAGVALPVHPTVRRPAPSPAPMRVAVDGGIWVVDRPGRPAIMLHLPPPPNQIAVDIDDSGDDTRAVGSILLTVGLAGIVAVTLFGLWPGSGRWSRGRPGATA